jgi:hypothetical protein
MVGKYQVVFKNQVFVLPRNLRSRRCGKCEGSLRFFSSDGKRSVWTCGGSCGMFSRVIPVSSEEKRATESYQKQLKRCREIIKDRRDARIEKMEAKYRRRRLLEEAA